jgi:hypothetical protein
MQDYKNKNVIIITNNGTTIKGVVENQTPQRVFIDKSGAIIPPMSQERIESSRIEVSIGDIQVIGEIK